MTFAIVYIAGTVVLGSIWYVRKLDERIERDRRAARTIDLTQARKVRR